MTRRHPSSLPDAVVSIFIEVPAQRVWNEITRTGKVQPAVVNTVLESDLEPGSRLRYYSKDRKRVFVVGEVLEIDPPKRLVHTYWFTTWKKGTPTVVTWELTPEGNGCRVTITHSGWTTEHEAAKETQGGWESILSALKQLLETGRIPLKARLMHDMMLWFAFLLPKTTRREYADEHGW